jgi:hypothetical protein
LSDNIAWSGMTLNDATVSAGTDDTGAGKNGLGKIAAELTSRTVGKPFSAALQILAAAKPGNGYRAARIPPCNGKRPHQI